MIRRQLLISEELPLGPQATEEGPLLRFWKNIPYRNIYTCARKKPTAFRQGLESLEIFRIHFTRVDPKLSYEKLLY